MFETNTANTTIKHIDETRHGEAFQTETTDVIPNGKSFYIESYGCQMNFSDSEIVASILMSSGYKAISSYEESDLILLNTCSIRENAEEKIRNRLKQFDKLKRTKPGTLIGVLGCMAERLKDKLLDQEKLVDLVVGPDAYKTLPGLIVEAEGGQKAVNVLLSREETYAEINPVRLGSNGVTAFISIMRGCDNMCSFCVVPFTRGRERSRDIDSIINEAKDLFDRGYREVTLLGQNVDSYKWTSPKTNEIVNFATLLERSALIHSDLRIRFSTSHPKDITDEVLHTIAKYENICNYIHLPVQSGNSEVLKRMNRTYDRKWYLDRIHAIQRIIPDCGISADIITGFCGETEEQHQDTLSIMEYVKYDLAYMFFYSERPGTLAARKYEDDIPLETKKRRLQEVIALQLEHAKFRNEQSLGKTYKVLVERKSKRSDDHLCGRTDQNKMVVFPKGDHSPGDYVHVNINDCTSATLMGEIL